jgi:hypothetical protein
MLSMRCVLLLLSLFPALCRAQRAGVLEGKRIAVLEFRVESGVQLDSLETLTDDCRGAVADATRGAGALTLTRSNMDAVIKAVGGECKEGECELETARNINVDHFLTGTVAKVQGELQLTLQVYESRVGSLLGHRRVNALTELTLLEAAPRVTAALVREALLLPAARDESPRERRVADERFTESAPRLVLTPDNDVVVKFESEPSGAAVRLDGRHLCDRSPCSKRVSVGPHEISFGKERYFTQTFRETLTGPTRISRTLAPKFGVLEVVSAGEPVAVTVNGKAMGQTPLATLEVDEGQVEVKLADRCYVAESVRFFLGAGERKRVELKALPREAGVRVDAEDTRGNAMDGDVYVEGRRSGVVGKSFTVPLCSTALEVRAGELSWSSKLALEEGRVQRLRAELLPVEPVRTASPGGKTRELNPEERKALVAELESRSLVGEFSFSGAFVPLGVNAASGSYQANVKNADIPLELSVPSQSYAPGFDLSLSGTVYRRSLGMAGDLVLQPEGRFLYGSGQNSHATTLTAGIRLGWARPTLSPWLSVGGGTSTFSTPVGTTPGGLTSSSGLSIPEGQSIDAEAWSWSLRASVGVNWRILLLAGLRLEASFLLAQPAGALTAKTRTVKDSEGSTQSVNMGTLTGNGMGVNLSGFAFAVGGYLGM